MHWPKRKQQPPHCVYAFEDPVEFANVNSFEVVPNAWLSAVLDALNPLTVAVKTSLLRVSDPDDFEGSLASRDHILIVGAAWLAPVEDEGFGVFSQLEGFKDFVVKLTLREISHLLCINGVY